MVGSSHWTIPPSLEVSWFERTTIMFKKIAFFALFLAVTGLFAATSVNAQRLVKVTKSASLSETLTESAIEANASVTLRQCANGGIGDLPAVQDCGAGGTDNNWETGNMNGSKAHYAEGKSIHYRAVFGGLTPGTSYTVVLGYDITKGSPDIHAIDYLKGYDADITAPLYTVTPCGALTASAGHPCATNTSSQIQIPDDPDVPAAIEPVAARYITAWGATGTAAPLTYGTPAERLITITFTPTVSNPVFGWSGHIALGSAWLAYNGGTGAGSISGSPYHMYNRGGGVNDFSGSQDLQLASSAIPQVSAAGANISGRVTDYYNRAIPSAKLSLTNSFTGVTEVVYTNTFGYYTFKDVAVGDFFMLSVSARRYTFADGALSFTVQDNLDGVNFKASR